MPRMRMRGALVVFAIMMAAACGGSSEPNTRTLTSEEQSRILGLAEIGIGDDGYDRVVGALVSGGYLPVQLEEVPRDELNEEYGVVKAGTLRYVRCQPGQTTQECAAMVPSAERPDAFTGFSEYRDGNGGTTISAGGTNEGLRFRAMVSPQASLECAPETRFQLNNYTVTAVPRVFQTMTEGGRVRTGDIRVPFGPTPDDFYPKQEEVSWSCR